jgi:hypothetical protein
MAPLWALSSRADGLLTYGVPLGNSSIEGERSSPVTQSPSAEKEERPRLEVGLIPWTPPSTASAPGAIEPPDEEAPFVFHDPAGRRWSRIKRVGLVGASALLVVGGGVFLAVTRVAPGRAPAFAGVPAQPEPDWQTRNTGSAPASPNAAVPTAPPAPGVRRTTAAPTARPSPTVRPTKRPTPTPRHTPMPPIPPPPTPFF